MKRKISSVMLFVLSVVLLMCTFAFSTGAEERATPAVSIEKFNLVFEDNVYLKYAVKFNGVEESEITENNIGMLYFKAPSVAYVAGNEDFSSGVVGYTTIDGEKYYTFEYRHVSAKQMTDYVYSVAYIDIGGERYYSAPNKFSVLEYCCSKLGKTGVASTNEDYKNLLTVTLEQGAMAQKYFGYKTERPANAEYYLVEVIGGTLADGFSRGLYHAGETAILTAPETKGELAFFGWQNSAGKIVSADARFEVSEFLQNETYTAVYEAKMEFGTIGATITSAILNEAGTKLIITCADGTEAEIDVSSTECADGCEDVTVHEFKGFEHSAVYNEAEGKWKFEEGKYLAVCADCGHFETFAGVIHDFAEATVAPTCTEIGFDGRYCLACNYYEVIAGTEKAALDHSFTVENDVIDDGRDICTEGSWQLSVCDRDDCGATKPVYVPAPGHTVEKWVERTAPTATQRGRLVGTCTVCGVACEIEIPALNETDYAYAVEAASCLVAGKETWTYSLNEQTFVYEIILPASGHTVESWSKNTTPTATQSGTLVGTCAVCGESCEMEIPAFNETDYAYAVEGVSCLVDGEGSWIYSLNEQTFVYEVILPAKGHRVDGTPVAQLKRYGDAFVYGQRGIVVLNGVDLECEMIADGFFVCDDCGMSVSIRVYGDHVWGEPTVVPATCTSGTKTVKVCTVEGCGVEDEQIADDRLDHSLVYSLVEKDGAFKFTTKCANCTTMDSARDVTDLVELDFAGSKAATCSKGGYNKYVYEYAVGKTVSCRVTVPATNIHAIVVNGVVVKPDANGYYSSAYVGKGITALCEPDLVTCGLIADGYGICVCGVYSSVKIINPHNLVYDAENVANKAPTCTETGVKVWKCDKACCQTVPYYEYETLPKVDHVYTYFLVADGDLLKVVGVCNTCDYVVEYDGLTEEDFEETIVPSTCTTQGTYTITLKKQIAGVTVPPLVTKLGLAPHSVEHGKYITDCETVSAGVYKYNTRYFVALDLPDLVCGETFCFNGYFWCSECGGAYSVTLAADHVYGDYVVVEEPTCTRPGKKVAECECGAKDEVLIDLPYHQNLTAILTVLPTTACGGVLKITCACGDFYNYEIPALTNTEFYAEFEVDEDDPDCYNYGAMKYTGKVAVPVNGFFAAKELDVAFTVITAIAEHSAQPPVELIVYTVRESIAYADWDVTYTVYQCEICGKYIVVNAERLLVPMAPASSEED